MHTDFCDHNPDWGRILLFFLFAMLPYQFCLLAFKFYLRNLYLGCQYYRDGTDLSSLLESPHLTAKEHSLPALLVFLKPFNFGKQKRSAFNFKQLTFSVQGWLNSCIVCRGCHINWGALFGMMGVASCCLSSG